ncbi:MAG: hypothetical protein M3P49_12205 [Actinomycetota bacterium]|nr:hypothetical protein [Actinomycetota bacterium]
MAPSNSEKIDWLIGHVERRLGSLPEVETRFGEWDEDEQVAFVMEWSIPEGNLRELEDLSEQGLMSEQQEERFAELQRLAEESAPILKRLWRASA